MKKLIILFAICIFSTQINANIVEDDLNNLNAVVYDCVADNLETFVKISTDFFVALENGEGTTLQQNNLASLFYSCKNVQFFHNRYLDSAGFSKDKNHIEYRNLTMLGSLTMAFINITKILKEKSSDYDFIDIMNNLAIKYYRFYKALSDFIKQNY